MIVSTHLDGYKRLEHSPRVGGTGSHSIESRVPVGGEDGLRNGDQRLAAKKANCLKLFFRCRGGKPIPDFSDIPIYARPSGWRGKRELETGCSHPPQFFPASVVLRRPDDFCAVEPKAKRVKHHEERRRNASLAAAAVDHARAHWPLAFGNQKRNVAQMAERKSSRGAG